jgi:hypothetical protein
MKRLSVSAALLGLLFVACGGGSTSGSSTTPPTNVTTTGDTVTGGLDLSQCNAAAAAMAAAAAAVPQAISGVGGDIQQSVDQLRAATEAAPEEIRADLQTVTDGYAAVAEILAGASIQPGQLPSAEVLQQLAAAGQQINATDFQAAVGRVAAWFQNQCGK